jgi:lipid A 3-O-deacylase
LFVCCDSDIVLDLLRFASQGDKVTKAFLGIAVLTLIGVVHAPRLNAQASPENSSRELQIWTGGGHGINGSQSGTGVWNLGLRYGLILTAPLGPGILKGQLEYAFDVVPVWVITQKTNTAYGGSVDPFAFKWIFSSAKKVNLFFQIEGGALFTNTKVPEGTSQINFTTSGGIGAHFLGKKHNFSAEVRFQHISNAGMTNPNPGINTMQLRIGFGEFRN